MVGGCHCKKNLVVVEGALQRLTGRRGFTQMPTIADKREARSSNILLTENVNSSFKEQTKNIIETGKVLNLKM